jgi:hypothetical protein
MIRRSRLPAALAALTGALSLVLLGSAADREPVRAGAKVTQKYPGPINVQPPAIAGDPSVKYDYPIVYVRAPRRGDQEPTQWADANNPLSLEPGSDLMLLRPDGSEELLVPGGDGAVLDPVVSFDGEWVFYAHARKNPLTTPAPRGGADIYKIHVKSKKVLRLTDQTFAPNTGAARWAKDCRQGESGRNAFPYGVLNLGPCQRPGRKLAFVSNRHGFIPPHHHIPALQLFVMDDPTSEEEAGTNLECIGHLNVGMALHPVVLKDGRIMFSSLENQGMRGPHLWGLWSIHPDGTNWGPLLSAYDNAGYGTGANDTFHFQTQLSDGSLVIEKYYLANNFGFSTYVKLAAQAPDGYAPFGPAHLDDPRNPPVRFGRHAHLNGQARLARFPFSPHGLEALTPFVTDTDSLAGLSVLGQKDSPAVGKFTHPSGTPDNHLLTVWSPGPVNRQHKLAQPAPNGGIYLIKDGKPLDEPGQMLLIKTDPRFNAQWPRALVPYRRIYGIDEPGHLTSLANDGKRSPHLPEGTPFGLIGTASFYKRESYPNGVVPQGSVTATYAGGTDPYRGLDPFLYIWATYGRNWKGQGADAGLYSNEDIHAVRILGMEPTTDRRGGFKPGRQFASHANERLRILGEIPLRKFPGSPHAPREGARHAPRDDYAGQPLDPDGNPDTSFLARIPADVPFTFQTLDKNGLVLNMAQTWHQLRPGEVRNNCGGCHAHSQKPTRFEDTAAAKPDYKVFDLTRRAPLLTSRQNDQSGSRWDRDNSTGLRYQEGPLNVEFYRDVKPILQRSCVACHTQKADRPAGNLVLDDDTPLKLQPSYPDTAPGTYHRLALDRAGKYGPKPPERPVGFGGWGDGNASRYVRLFQARRSLLIWKVYGLRTDGWSNDDFTSEIVPGDYTSLQHKGQPVDPKTLKYRDQPGKAAPPYNLAYSGSAMPPPEAVAGTYVGPDGKKIKVAPLTDEDRRTLARWIDLGCPIDLDYDPGKPQATGYGWMLDDTRPTLTVALPRAGANEPLTRLVIGMHDYYTGLEPDSVEVVADFPLAGVAPGTNLAPKLRARGDGVWELPLPAPLSDLPRGKLTVSVKDRQGNVSRIERTFSVTAPARGR